MTHNDFKAGSALAEFFGAERMEDFKDGLKNLLLEIIRDDFVNNMSAYFFPPDDVEDIFRSIKDELREELKNELEGTIVEKLREGVFLAMGMSEDGK